MIKNDVVYKDDGNEDFSSQYTNVSAISKYLINNYYRNIEFMLGKIQRPRKVIEIGCGEGYSTKRIRDIIDPKSELVASDILEWQVKEAKKNNPTVDIVKEDVYKLKRKNNEFDLVLLLEVLEHLDKYKLALKEIRRVSNKYVIIGVPNEPVWSLLNLIRGAYVTRFGNTPGHINHWSEKSLRLLMVECGFKVLDIKKPLPWLIALLEKD